MKKFDKIFNNIVKKGKKLINEGIKQVKIYSRDRINLAIALLVILVVILGALIIGFVKTILLALLIILMVLVIKEGGMMLMKKKKKTNQKETKQGKKRKLALNIIITIFLVASILIILLGIAFMGYVIVSAPKFNTKNLLYKEASIVYDKNGVELTRLGNELRENITYDQLPQVFIDAIVATEDSRFFEHNGFDLPRFMKASAGQALGNSGAGGASTITMQVIKNNFTSSNQTIVRKFTDIYLAVFKLEKSYTKEQILEFYVNNIHLGVNNTLGIAETAKELFGKDISNINLSEAALLAGMFQAPGSYNPYKYPEAADKRRKTVLYLMEKHGYINSDEYNIASSVPISSLVIPQTSTADKYQGYIDYAVAEAEEKTGLDPMEVSMKIYTNLDTTKQDYINNILNGTTWTWENDLVQSGIAVTDVNSGAIVALGTSRNQTGQKLYSFATDISRQIGSTAKPLFDYGPGMEYNNFSTYTPFVDDVYSYTGGKSISDWDGKYQGLETARLALSGSRNIPALKAFQQLDKKKVIAFVESLGITPEVENGTIHEAHAIGGFNGVSPLQMAAAYAAFSNGGYYYKPYAVNKVEITETDKVTTYSSEKVKVMSDSTAYMITNILKGGVDSGLIGGGKVNGVEVAAKSGTTNFDEATEKTYHLGSNAINDLWYVGYSPDYSIGMWYGYEKISSVHYSKMNITSSIRNKLFTAIAKGIFDKNGKSFTMPSSVVASRVENGTIPAMLPSAYTPSSLIITEYFKKGTEPTEVSPRFNTLPSVTNLAASAVAGTIKLSWTAVTKPNMITAEYLATISAQSDKYLGIYQNQDNNLLGTLGYNVYLKNTDGSLTKIDWTSDINYTYTPTLSGDLNFVVKACYSNFKASESAAVTVTATNPLSGIIVTWPSTTINIQRNSIFNIHQGITVMDGTTDVTGAAVITQTVNDIVKTVFDTSKIGTFTIKYTASYKGINETFTRKVTVN